MVALWIPVILPFHQNDHLRSGCYGNLGHSVILTLVFPQRIWGTKIRTTKKELGRRDREPDTWKEVFE